MGCGQSAHQNDKSPVMGADKQLKEVINASPEKESNKRKPSASSQSGISSKTVSTALTNSTNVTVKKNLNETEQTVDMVNEVNDNGHGSTLINVLSTDESNQLEPSYMYMSLLKKILLTTKYDNNDKKEFINYSRRIYGKDEEQKVFINRFEKDYNSQLAVRWYTEDCFIYRTMNLALRELDIETIMKMGFFIRDLHEQLQRMYEGQSDKYERLIVYRGLRVQSDLYNKLNKTGNLISFNGFSSTTLDPTVAMNFLNESTLNTNQIGVLFEMRIDRNLSTMHFADISQVSVFKKEKEILLSMHTVFRIDGTTSHSDGYKMVTLSQTKDTDPLLKKLTEHFEKEIGKFDPLEQLARLLIKMSMFNHAQKILDKKLENENNVDWIEKIRLNNGLGYIYHKKDENNKALGFYKNALDIAQGNLSKHNSLFATIYNNIGSTYYSKGDYKNALSHYGKALEIKRKSSVNGLNLADIYHNMATLDCLLGDYESALEGYKKVLSIRQQTLPANHPDIARVYDDIGSVYHFMGDDTEALTFYEKALEIQEKSLLSQHIDRAITYSNLGIAYSAMGDHKNALEYHEKSLKIRLESLPPTHPDIALSYNNIGSVHSDIGAYDKAMQSFKEALKFGQRSDEKSNANYSAIHDNMGRLCELKGDLSEAESEFQKALDIRQKALDEDHPDMAISYNNMGNIYSVKGDQPKALQYYTKGLEIQKTISIRKSS